MPWVESVNHFWFQEIDPNDWFSGSAAIDALIAARFGALRAELKRNPPRAETLTSEGHLAAVIVFDQFSRNIFRGSPEAYATDDLALALASHAIDAKLDAPLGVRQRHFLYMPFMHSEDRAMQARSIELFTALGDEDTLQYARHHKEIVDRFGRFPHRNEILGRASTPDELEFLRSGSQSF
jgi:uncharacterized protein (DUF924 family)